jgi:hypothetical protein
MVCELCKKKVATVHLTHTSIHESGEPINSEQRHFCEDCADNFYANDPGLNSARGLIQLSDQYRSKLFDRLEQAHPEIFRNWAKSSNVELIESAKVMHKFIREDLKRNGIELNEEGFHMLAAGFIGAAEFYERAERFKRAADNQ